MDNKRAFYSMIIIMTGIIVIYLSLAYKKEAWAHNDKNVKGAYINIQEQDAITDKEIEKLEIEKYIIVYDEQQEKSIKVKNNITRVLDYAQKEYDIYEVESYSKLPSRLTGVIICLEDLDCIKDIDYIFEYVKEGGSLFLAMRPSLGNTFKKYSEQLGIEEVRGEVQETGIRLVSDLIIGANTFESTDDFMYNRALDVKLYNKASVKAELPSGIPLIWDIEYGKGKMVVFNGDSLHESNNRGLVIGSIALLKQNFIYPIINANVQFIDDYPSPISDYTVSQMYSNLSMNVDQFYKNIWWPDMARLCNKYGVKYSTTFTESYNNKVTPPFDRDTAHSVTNLSYYGPEIIRLGGEIGIHGYNKQPLTYNMQDVIYENNTPWQSSEHIKLAFDEVYETVHSIYPEYSFKSYVPPSNILSDEVRKNMKEFASETKSISSKYGIGNEIGVYYQEFETAKDGIVEFPRISEGYFVSESQEWNIFNGLSLHGVFSHSIYPDDLFDTAKSGGASWDDLYYEYERILDEVNKKYKWLRNMTISEATEELKRYETAALYLVEEENEILGYINGFKGSMYYVLRTDKEIIKSEGAKYQKVGDNVYWIYVDKPHFKLKLEGRET